MRVLLLAVLLTALSPWETGAQLPSCSVGGLARECQIPPRSATVLAEDSIGGDMEFAGHPVAVSVQASRRLSRDSTVLVVDLEIVAIEVTKDSTWISGTDSVVVFTADRGWRIVGVHEGTLATTDQMWLVVRGKEPVTVIPDRVTADRDGNDGLCLRHPSDVCRSTTDEGIVARWTVWADTDRRDLGRSRMVADLASTGVRVERRAATVVSGRDQR